MSEKIKKTEEGSGTTETERQWRQTCAALLLMFIITLSHHANSHTRRQPQSHTPLSVRHRPPSVVHLRLRRPQVSLQRPHQRKHANSRRSRQILGINFRNKSSQFFFCFVHPIRSQNSRRRRVLLLPRPLTNSHSFTNKSIMCGEHEETRG